MENIINKQFSVSPFLQKFMEVMGLFNVEILKKFHLGEIKQRLFQYFIKNIHVFIEDYEYFGFNLCPNKELLLEKFTGGSLEDVLKPGDFITLEQIAEYSHNYKGYEWKQSTDGKVMILKLIQMAGRSFQAFGFDISHNHVEVEVRKIKNNITGKVYCKIGDCESIINISCRKGNYWSNSNLTRHIQSIHKLAPQKRKKRLSQKK
uniref:CSON007614 protein n=1 Tax=Culicoides sonorensis TaxID=179676 RepID=A0A336N0J4_CULSO